MYSILCKPELCRFEIVWYTNITSHLINQTSWRFHFKLFIMGPLKRTQCIQNKIITPHPISTHCCPTAPSPPPSTLHPFVYLINLLILKCIMYNFDFHITYSNYSRKYPGIPFQLISHPNRGNYSFEDFLNKLVLFLLELK